MSRFTYIIKYFVIVFKAYNSWFFKSEELILTPPCSMGNFTSIVRTCHDMSETTSKTTVLEKKMKIKVIYMFQ